MGTKKGLEADLVPKAGIPFRIITVEGLERKISLRNFRAFVKAAIGSFQAWVILNTFRPEIVVGTGAVSYTHLDVYKRQGYHRPQCHRIRTPDPPANHRGA